MTLIVYSTEDGFVLQGFVITFRWWCSPIIELFLFFFFIQSINKKKILGITLNRQITSWIFILFPLSLVPVYISLHPQFSLYFFHKLLLLSSFFSSKNMSHRHSIPKPCIGILMAFLYWLCAQFNKIFLMQEFMWSA